MARLKKRTDLRSRPPLERMQRIFQMIKNERLPNCSTLAGEMEVSAKTIQRDIDFMRDRMALPIEYDSAQHGFYFTRPVAAFPAITVSEAELVSLFVARKAVEQYSGTAFEKPLATAFAKLTEGLSGEIEFNWQELDSEVTFRSVGLSRQDLALFEAVAGAIRQRRELEFEYRKIGGKPEVRRVQPLGLLCVDGQWYLRGWDLVRRDQRTFHLGRMKKAKPLPHTFERPASFDVNEAFVNSIGVYESNRVEQVVLRFHGWAAQVVTERTWHPSQKIRSTRDGVVEISLKVAITLSSSAGSGAGVTRWRCCGRWSCAIRSRRHTSGLRRACNAGFSPYAGAWTLRPRGRSFPTSSLFPLLRRARPDFAPSGFPLCFVGQAGAQ